MTALHTVVAVVSPKGGVGKTTVVANLGAALGQIGSPALLVDLDPQNALRLHLQMPVDQPDGLSVQALGGRPVADAIFRSPFGVAVLPYGTVAEVDRARFEALLGHDPDWFGRALAALDLPADTIIVVDTPPGGSIYLQQALRAANLLLCVLLPDAASFVTIPTMDRWLALPAVQRADFRGGYYLLNRMNHARALCRDVWDAMREQLGPRLVQEPIPFDSAVEEALATQLPLSRYLPSSPAAAAFESLARWLVEMPS